MKKSYLLLFVLAHFTLKLFAQKNIPDPDDVLVGNRKQPSILFVGTFHFAYYNLDAHKTDKDKQIDILSVQKQEELTDLLDYIEKQITGLSYPRYKDSDEYKKSFFEKFDYNIIPSLNFQK